MGTHYMASDDRLLLVKIENGFLFLGTGKQRIGSLMQV